ncbi:MAG: M14 family zinc carboxypeptidase [Bdellovibrionota bacterium]|nr:M14 family zinc carboxypeptidase [Bdellovibrionota bacterium]
MKNFVFGKSEWGQAILGFRFGNSAGKKVLLLGGVHGDEIEGIAVANALISKYIEQDDLNLELSIVPSFNPDGTLSGNRKNANGVDLNRNLPSKDWTSDVANERYYPGTSAGSESENKALMKYLDENDVDFIISLHSFSRFLLNVNGDCEPIASALHNLTGYPIDESMGYPTPGCLGTYTGLEQGIPTITYELERGKDPKELIAVHCKAIHEALKVYSETN